MSTETVYTDHVLVISRDGRNKPIEMRVLDRAEFLASIAEASYFYMDEALRMGIEGISGYGVRRAVETNVGRFLLWGERGLGHGRWVRAVHVDGSLPKESLAVQWSKDSMKPFVITADGVPGESVDATEESLTQWILAK